MATAQCLRQFLFDRLTAAAEEIFGVFEKVLIEYKEEIYRQRSLHDTDSKPDVKQHAIDPQQHYVSKHDEGLAEKQLYKQEWNSSLDQEGPEPPQFKEEPCTTEDGENLELTREMHSLIMISTCVGSHSSEDQRLDLSPAETDIAEEKQPHDASAKISVVPKANSDEQLLVHSSPVDENQNHKIAGHENWKSNANELPEMQRLDESSGYKNEVYKSIISKVQSNSYNGANSFACETCGKAFRDRTIFHHHMTTHTSEKPHLCNTCGKSFTNLTSFKEHMMIHTAVKPHSCKVCGKEFRRNTHLEIHMRAHTGEKPYSCTACEKKFRQSSALTHHMRIHTGEKPFPCEACGKTFTNTSALKVHMRMHTGEKPYSCKACGKDFRQSTHLKLHMRRHTDEKPFSCKICEKRFRSSSSLRSHERTHTV